MAKPNNNKNYFERAFGPKKNPKVEKQADARFEKKMKKEWSFSKDQEGWDHHDKFEKGKHNVARGKSGDSKFKRNNDSGDNRSFRRDEDKSRDFSKGSDRPSFNRNGSSDEKRSFRRDDNKSRDFNKGTDKPSFKRSYGGEKEIDFKRKRSFDNDKEKFKSNSDRFNDKKSFNNEDNRGQRKNYNRDDVNGGDNKRNFERSKDTSRRSFDGNNDRDFKKKRSFDNNNENFRSKSGSFKSKDAESYSSKDYKNRDDRKGGFDRKADKGNEPRKKFGQDIFAKEKKKENEFYSEEDRARLFGTEAFKDRVLKELEEEINEDFDEIKKKKAINKKNESRAKRESKRESEDYRITKYIDDESEYEKAYESVGGKKWVIEGSKEDVENVPSSSESMPLNKYLAHCGVCSRRDAVQIIKNGKIAVDGNVITEPGFKVTPEHQITMEGKKLQVQKNLIYILMNKPKGFITTTDDPKGRKTVMDMVENHIEERVFPVGRLDRNTTGLLLLTNDGDLAQQLAHPKYEIRKIYHVVLDKNVSKADFDKIINGIELEDGVAQVDHLAYLDAKNELGIEIHSGKNRIVRRIFESCGYVVEKLDRVMYAGLTKKNLPRGKFRLLAKQEVINLKHFGKK